MRSLFLLCLYLCTSLGFAQNQLPDAQTRSEIIYSLASEMQRLDGEALLVRQNRNLSWAQMIQDLQREAQQSNTWAELLKNFACLDQAYPNLHSSLTIGDHYTQFVLPKIDLSVPIVTEWQSPNEVQYKTLTEDQLIAINGRSINQWQKENFEFCKFPLLEQCDMLLISNLQKELLAWDRTQPLQFTLKNGAKIWTTEVQWNLRKSMPPPPHQDYCKNETNRYQNFQRVYTGNRTCVYESSRYPDTAILRITSFYYSPSSLKKN